MSPRPYTLGRRQEAIDQTRARIIAAARKLLVARGGFPRFTIDAVAQKAGVARMTVYYQFGSKRELLEALYDDLAARGQMDRLAEVFKHEEPLDALTAFIAAFARFWASDRLVIRRLHGLVALDPEVERGSRAREERRRRGLRVLVQRVAKKYGRPAPSAIDQTVDILQTLTSFETFDTLAGSTRNIEEVTPWIDRLARDALGLR